MNSNFIIYKVVNSLTSEAYIGATTKTVNTRIEDHLQKSENGTGHKLHEAISTYGFESFVWEQIDTAYTINDLAKKEIYYIEEFDTLLNGYNSDKGGGFKKNIYKYNLDGTLENSFENLTDAGESINVRKQDISRACWSVNNILQGFYWSYDYNEPFIPNHDNRKKEVLQFDLDDVIIERYTSASEASRKTGISKTCITRCCRGERIKTGGFLWQYA